MRYSFTRDSRGTTAVIFAIACVPLIAAAGLAIDYSRVSAARGHMQSLADAAALAAARFAPASEEEAQELARAHLAAHPQASFLTDLDDVRVTLGDTGQIRVEIDAGLATTFGGVVGVDQLPLSVASEVVRGVKGSLELALVLDNTGSMEGSRLSTLKRVTRRIVDDIAALDQVDARFAVIPFSDYVNVGLSRRNASWINVPPDREETEYACWRHRPVIEENNCRTVVETRYRDGIAYRHEYRQCDRVYGDEVEECGVRTHRYEWRGCVGSRNHPLNVGDASYSDRVPGLQNISCAAEVLPLSDDADRVRSALENMVAQGETYIPGGLVWGWRMLSPGAPFDEGQAYDADNMKPRKVIILLTDGVNTKSPTFPRHDGSNSSETDGYVEEICTNAKAHNIEIFTVAFEVVDADIKSILGSCASSPANYFDAGDDAALEAAFATMTSSLMNLRISR